MNRIKSKLTVLLALLCSILVISCEDDPPGGGNEDPGSSHDANVGVVFDGDAVILGVSGEYAADITKAFETLIPLKSASVDENTDLLVVPELSESFATEIETVYNNGGIVAVAAPSYANVKQWFESHKIPIWQIDERLNHALIYSFSDASHQCVVAYPDDEYFIVDKADIQTMADKNDDDFFFKHLYDEEEIVEEETEFQGGADFATSYVEDDYNDMYTWLHPWITIMNEDIRQIEEINSHLARASEPDDVATTFRAYPYSQIFSFNGSKTIRKCTGSKPDEISGNGSISVSYDIYQIHCYEDQVGQGDYYLVTMTASVANRDMYRGVHRNLHGGVHVRWCGFYATSFEIECTPVDADGNELPADYVMFTTAGFPSPATTIGKTTYTTSTTTNLSLGGSVTAGGKKDKGAYAEGTFNVSGGWVWSHSESRDIADTDISNNSAGNNVRYKLTFNNLPYYRWGAHFGIDEGNSQTYRSTSEIRASWVWYVPSAKDDDNELPINIRFKAKPSYGDMSWITSKVDLHTHEYSDMGNVETVINLENFIREKCGYLVINNNFSDDTAIKNIRIYRATDTEKKDLLWESTETIVPGKDKKTSAFRIKDKYMIYLTTVDGREYEYSTYSDGVTLESCAGVNVYAATDFKLVN